MLLDKARTNNHDWSNLRFSVSRLGRIAHNHVRLQVPTLVRSVGLLLLGIALGAGAMWAYHVGFPATSAAPSEASSQTNDRPPPRESPTKKVVFALGTLEPRGGAVLVTSSLVGTEIRAVLAREGQFVEQGDLLIELDATVAEQELRIAEGQRAQASERQQAATATAVQRLEAAKLALEQSQAAREPELATQRQQLAVARLKAEQARADLARLESLARGASPLVSAQQVEQQRTLIKLAEAETGAAELALQRLEQTLNFNLQKAQAEKKAAQQSWELTERGTGLATLERQIDLAEHKLKQTRVTAPSAGTVISILTHPGERVSSQPLLQIANLKNLQCEAEVDVADVALLADKHEAFISSRAFRGTKIKATIERIRNVAGAATLRPVDPRKAVDRTVATVVLSVDAALATQLLGGSVADAGAALMGLQVDVEIPL